MTAIAERVCGHYWVDGRCPNGTGIPEHVCVRFPDHRGRHECSCGKRSERIYRV